MKLSKRLKEVETLIEKDRNVIDVGCDHALLDIYLALNRQNIKITATDISSNAIEGAKKNAKYYKVEDKINFIVTNGLDKIKLNSNDILVITGMGGYTMLDILKNNNLPNTLILSAHKDIELIRREIVKLGYYIKKEKAIFDKKWYVIILFEKGLETYEEDDYILGLYTKNNKEYMNYLYEKNKKIALKTKSKNEIIKKIEKYL